MGECVDLPRNEVEGKKLALHISPNYWSTNTGLPCQGTVCNSCLDQGGIHLLLH